MSTKNRIRIHKTSGRVPRMLSHLFYESIHMRNKTHPNTETPKVNLPDAHVIK